MIEKYFTEEEKKRVLNFLLLLFIFFLFGLIFLLMVMPGIRNANKPESLPESLTTSLKTGWLEPTEYPPLKEEEDISLTKEEILNPSEKTIQRGDYLYGIYCISCHGEKGEGDGIGAINMVPPPRNFKKVSDFKNGANIQGIYKTLLEGIPNTSMQSYEYLSKNSLISISLKVLRLGNINITEDKNVESFISNLFSQREPPKIKIPFSFAKKIMIEEHKKMKDLENIDPLKYFQRDFIEDKEKAKVIIFELLKISKNYEDFKKGILHSLGNGFSPKLIYLKEKDWQEIYNKIKGDKI